MSYKLESDVAKSLGELLKTQANYDVIIYIGEKPYFKEFHAHSVILCCRSHYFNSILSAKDTEKRDGKYVIKKPNITPQAFDFIIQYLYTGHINFNNKTGTELLSIMITSDELNLKQLTELAEDFLIENQQQFLRNDSVGILQIVYYHQTFNNMREFCLEEICSEPRVLFDSAKFINLPAPILEVILKRDDLNLDEIEVWDNLIKWGLAQEKTLSEDFSKWHQDEFNIFKRILHRFIPLIRFYEISSDDYFNKVKPFEEILSKELREEILKFHMVSGYKPTLNVYSPRRPKCVDSVLIHRKHIALFTHWIERKEETFKYAKVMPYEFNLIFRGSRDGFDPVSFHNNCNGKGANIVVIKIKNSNQIVGGYNPIDWGYVGYDRRYNSGYDRGYNRGYNRGLNVGYDNRCFNKTSDSFIFSFINGKNLKTGEIGRVINTNYAIGVSDNAGPIFGGTNRKGKSDLMFSKDQWSSVTNSYPNVNIPRYFEIDDYEVFQVKRKSYNLMKSLYDIFMNA